LFNYRVLRLYGENMQRAAFPELQGRPRASRHRRPERADRVLIGLKVATCVAAAGLLAVVVLLITAGTGAPAAKRSPSVPRIPSGDDASATTTTTAIAPPELRSDTAEIAGAAPTTTTSQPRRSTRTPKPPRQPNIDFAVVGERCSSPGAFSVTREYEPVMCLRRSPTAEPRWAPVF
jgi:hypothetical protein